jgi:uncharacterized protein
MKIKLLKNKPLVIAGKQIIPGTQETILFPSPNINTQIKIEIPVHIFHGKIKGPSLFVIGAIHGDEVNSIEILRRVYNYIKIKKLHGTVIIIPVVNVYGLILQSRYLPDGRDLNRSFPGSENGSLAARLAHGLLELIKDCDYGIDLHTGALGRVNIPQLRTNFEIPGAKKLAHAFGTPVILDAKLRDGSLREAVSELGIPVLVYEGGEALRFNELSIRAGVRGVINILKYLNMLSSEINSKNKVRSAIADSSRWIRASASGLVQPINQALGRMVKKNELIAQIHDPFLINKPTGVVVPFDGIVIGQALKPLASVGDALYHIASFKKLKELGEYLEESTSDAIFNMID